MNRTRSTVFVLLLVFFCSTVLEAGRVTPEQARRIAGNWLSLIVKRTGDWGGTDDTRVTRIDEIRRNSRMLGYFCFVEPQGFILISPVEGMAPVKAYSTASRFDPQSDEGLADLLKARIENILDKIITDGGDVATATANQVTDIVGIDHRSSWAMLDVEAPDFDPEAIMPGSKDDYHEGQILLTSNWHQGEPYNWQCPPPQPDHPECLLKPHCPVGCVATGAAQIMRYWSWPPGRDWKNMPDTLDITDPPAQITPTAELCRAIGDANDMDYCSYELDGCQSATWDEIEYIELFFQSWAYDDICADVWRIDYDATAWWNLIKSELAQNRPIFYGVRAHVIVCDGYSTVPYSQYHMNYGWSNDAYDAWYAVDYLFQPHPDGGPEYEYMIVGICPHGYLGPAVSGVYPYNPSYSWRYVDRDCQGASAQFASGNLIEFLPYTVMGCSSGSLRFDGQPGLHTRLFCPDISRGIVVQDGSIVMHPRGSIRFALRRP